MSEVSRAVGAKRLLKLVDFLKALPSKKFDYHVWVDAGTWKGKPDLSCGTKACALGWATVIPSFRRAGLFMEKIGSRRNNDGTKTYNGEVMLKGMEYPSGSDMEVVPSIYTAAQFFGLSLAEAKYLFTPDSNIEGNMPEDVEFDDERHLPYSPPGDASSKVVAKHIKQFVKNNMLKENK